MRHTTRGALCALLALGVAACEGNNLFPETPLSPTGGESAGTIAGQVTANGAGIPGAGVVVANGPTAATDAAGQFRITGVREGSYRVSLQVPAGFVLVAGDSATQTAVVTGGRSTNLSWRLQTSIGGGGAGTGTGTGTGT